MHTNPTTNHVLLIDTGYYHAVLYTQGPLECRQEYQRELVLNQRKGKSTACALTHPYTVTFP